MALHPYTRERFTEALEELHKTCYRLKSKSVSSGWANVMWTALGSARFMFSADATTAVRGENGRLEPMKMKFLSTLRQPFEWVTVTFFPARVHVWQKWQTEEEGIHLDFFPTDVEMIIEWALQDLCDHKKEGSFEMSFTLDEVRDELAIGHLLQDPPVSDDDIKLSLAILCESEVEIAAHGRMPILIHPMVVEQSSDLLWRLRFHQIYFPSAVNLDIIRNWVDPGMT